MAAEPTTSDPNLWALFFKDLLPVLLSAFAIIFSFYSLRKTTKNSEQNLKIQATFDDFNNQRHWRREKIYNLADEIFNLATEYWLCDEKDLKNGRCSLFIKSKIAELEENAIAIKIDISQEVMWLMHHATGADFESPDRKAIPSTHEKFTHIMASTQKIKSKLI